MTMSLRDEVAKFCESLETVEKPVEASLIVDDQFYSTVLVTYASGKPHSFVPKDGRNLDTLHKREAVLRMSGTDNELKIKQIRRCDLGGLHWHFDL